jgi:hypothetical protein
MSFMYSVATKGRPSSVRLVTNTACFFGSILGGDDIGIIHREPYG